jgi:5-formyltetrahydrofolate cyclo-ligase
MEPIAEAKAAARRAAYARRRAAHETLGPAAAAAACAQLLALLAGRPGPVSAYLPIRTEIDPGPAMRALAASGLRLCLPVIEGPGLPLRFREWTPGCALAAGPFGAAVPAAGDWLTPATLIVPLVAFDARRYRLGYGGGFYDRTLARLRAAGPVYAAGLAYAAQQVPALPVEPSDQPLDAIATETGSLP